MALKRKATFQPYDMDTALGTNNSGVLMFGYSLEDTDTVSSIISGGDDGGSDAPVFNAQDSVLWNNLRDAFRGEITQMYQQLRTSGAWSAQEIIRRAQEHQGQWCEAIYNEDQYYKHLIPLINPVTKDEHGNLIRTDRYLTMLQGSKEEQRKWWITNRYRYTDSKYVTGDAVNSVISMRLFNGGTLTLKAAIDLYLSVRFGGGSTPILQRKNAGESAEFTYTPGTGVTEMETWIYSADLITDVGDLSVFYGNEFDFSRATRLQRLKIGDGSANYSNTNLKTIDVRNSSLLEYIDVRNCPNLAITVNLEGSPILKEAYFDGTSITGCDLADGASIEKLHLPSTITTLTLVNLNKLTEFVCPDFSHVSRLMLSNMDVGVINPITILSAIPANSQVNIQGLHLNLADATAIDEFYDLLDTMRGVSREKNASGEWMYHDYDKAQVSGEIHTTSLTGAEIAEFNARYPYINITADSVTSYLTYKSWDGETTLATILCINGVPQESSPSAPTRPATIQYTYEFVGWSLDMDAETADASAITNVYADRTVYAAYSVTVGSHTVYFVRAAVDGGGTLQTINNVLHGAQLTNSSYTGETPTTIQGDSNSYEFVGWTPAFAPIVGDTTYTAVFENVVEIAEISDTWRNIVKNISNGTYKNKYKVGNYKRVGLGNGTDGDAYMQIVAIDGDDLADGSGKAPLTFIARDVLPGNRARAMNTTASSSGGWSDSALRNYLETTMLPNIVDVGISSQPSIADYIKPVIKITSTFENGVLVHNGQTTFDKVWLPSAREMFGDATHETEGVTYSRLFANNDSRIKVFYGSNNTAYWWLRTPINASNFQVISPTGTITSADASRSFSFAVGFCIGAPTNS